MWHAGVVSRESELTVAVTGPTGTFGFGLIPLLQAEDRVARIVGIARRPFDPAAYGWTKLEYRSGDVRHIVADPANAADVLGFRAAIDWSDGLADFAFAPLRG